MAILRNGTLLYLVSMHVEKILYMTSYHLLVELGKFQSANANVDGSKISPKQRKDINMQTKKMWDKLWVVPLPSNSDHQDYHIFSRESQPKPSFPTVTGKGDNSR